MEKNSIFLLQNEKKNQINVEQIYLRLINGDFGILIIGLRKQYTILKEYLHQVVVI